ncbi:MAG: hypothetical protein A3G75_07635 [Verrucomicrobia bacterium RIFCSPLOWO2_12_FULL_64_8]|nr:MAG: hypothetical protein A3G75_07635 [Verrucomicrobia bacterium RIFCSPLOWO2_12_FULL_64_8]
MHIPYRSAGRFWYVAMLSEGLTALAVASVRAAQKKQSKPVLIGRWKAPRPGVDTPLWNNLAHAVEAQLKRRGEKARLARFLGVSRQRLHMLVVAKTAYPDAERALVLQVWLQARLLGRDLVRPKSAQV